MKTRYVDIHIIQTVPPANLNRDETGSPKSAIFGGYRRARVSSQSWKRAARVMADAQLDDALGSLRTRRLVEKLAEDLQGRCGLSAEEAVTLAREVLTALGLKADDEHLSQYLLFLGHAQVQAIVEAVRGRLDELQEALGGTGRKKSSASVAAILKELQLSEKLAGPQPAAVALFGRMVADLPALNVDAAVQVAHAISTHAVELEFDFFTAVDDLNPEEETGAGMMGTVEFNAATLYRYASLNRDLLDQNLGDRQALDPTLSAFLRAWVLSIPRGHQTTFAHHCPPEFVLFVVHDACPTNLAGAFEDPVRAQDGRSISAESVRRLCSYLAEVSETYGLQPLQVTGVALQGAKAAVEASQSRLVHPGVLMPLDRAIEQTVEVLTRFEEGG